MIGTNFIACPKCEHVIDPGTKLEDHVCPVGTPPTLSELYEQRRFKLYIIDQSLIPKIFSKELEISNFPAGGQMADCGYRLDAQGFALLICHQDFEPVPPGETAPTVSAEWRQPRTLESQLIEYDARTEDRPADSYPGLSIYHFLKGYTAPDIEETAVWALKVDVFEREIAAANEKKKGAEK